MRLQDLWPSAVHPGIEGAAGTLLEAARTASPEAEFEIGFDPATGAPVLSGTAGVWQEVVDAGHAAAASWARLRSDPGIDLVVTADVPGVPAGPVALPRIESTPRHGVQASRSRPDAIVVGGGIVGAATTEALSRAGLKVLLVEGGSALGGATTAWNNGMVHPGHDPKPGALKARLNVEGNTKWAALARRIGLPFHRCPSLVVALGDDQARRLPDFLERARKNGVPGASIISGAEARRLEPRLNGAVTAALCTPSCAMIDAAQATRLLASAAVGSGAEVLLGAPVQRILTEGDAVSGVELMDGTVLEAPLVVNASGINADLLSATAGSRRYSLHARRGTLVLLRPGPQDTYPISAGPVPGSYSKGGGMTARPDGMTTAGPSAVEQRSRVSEPGTRAEIDALLEVGASIYPSFPFDTAVATGAEVRPVTYGEDFVVGCSPAVVGLVDVAGTQSPGIASAPAIADHVVDDLAERGVLSALRSRR